ncbi:MAG: hypothetical protein IJY22_05045 [Clostridia bacterium]|nr:hypothetical protein [Clostridia bacterium]
MKKPAFYTELAYLFGTVILAFGTALMEWADLGVSMVVAPAYVLHLKLSQYLPFFSFGMAEYTLQALIILFTILFLRRAKLSYLFSIVTAVFYGLLLDGAIALLALVSLEHPAFRILFFTVGMLLCSLGVSLLFHTYISPEAYELFVKEVSGHYGISLHKFKTAYDCGSCLVAVILSFCFFGWWQFEGIGIGTVICALLNGTIIHLCSKLLDHIWEFRDGLSWRGFFER